MLTRISAFHLRALGISILLQYLEKKSKKVILWVILKHLNDYAIIGHTNTGTRGENLI